MAKGVWMCCAGCGMSGTGLWYLSALQPAHTEPPGAEADLRLRTSTGMPSR